jgi:hypothetical protein
MRPNGTTKMSSDILLYPAIFIFSLLVIGLVFTVVEFSKIDKDDKDDKKNKDS